jgi:hypothetical protein
MSIRSIAGDLAVGLTRVTSLCIAAAVTLGVAASAQGAPRPACQHKYPDLDPAYLRLVLVYRFQGLTCLQAAAVGSAVATRYEQGLPVANYPAPPTGVPGGKGRPFDVATGLGDFNCRMTARGSDFVDATCASSDELVSFESLNHDYFAHPSPPQTAKCPGINLSVYGSTTPALKLQTHRLPRLVYGQPRCTLADRLARFVVAHLPRSIGDSEPTVWRAGARQAVGTVGQGCG